METTLGSVPEPFTAEDLQGGANVQVGLEGGVEGGELDGGAKHKKKRRSPSKGSPKRRHLSAALKKWNDLVYKHTGSRAPLRKSNPMYAMVKKEYERGRK